MPYMEMLEGFKKDTLKLISSVYRISHSIHEKLDGVGLEILREQRPAHIRYGIANYRNNKIRIYEPNVAHEFTENPQRFAESIGPLSKGAIELASKIPKDELFKIINQSGMDHELAGHFMNYFWGFPHGDDQACRTQYEMALFRSENDLYWKLAAELMPAAMKYHKGIDLL